MKKCEKKRLIDKARKKFTRIYPCCPHESLEDCFTRENDQYIFWFNTDNKSTHTVMGDASDPAEDVKVGNDT